jgi:hypothetical protein
MHVHAWLTQIVRISVYRCEQVDVTCEPMHIRGAFKEPGASFSDIFPQLQACYPQTFSCTSTIAYADMMRCARIKKSCVSKKH